MKPREYCPHPYHAPSRYVNPWSINSDGNIHSWALSTDQTEQKFCNFIYFVPAHPCSQVNQRLWYPGLHSWASTKYSRNFGVLWTELIAWFQELKEQPGYLNTSGSEARPCITRRKCCKNYPSPWPPGIGPETNNWQGTVLSKFFIS